METVNQKMFEKGVYYQLVSIFLEQENNSVGAITEYFDKLEYDGVGVSQNHTSI